MQLLLTFFIGFFEGKDGERRSKRESEEERRGRRLETFGDLERARDRGKEEKTERMEERAGERQEEKEGTGKGTVGRGRGLEGGEETRNRDRGIGEIERSERNEERWVRGKVRRRKRKRREEGSKKERREICGVWGKRRRGKRITVDS